MKAILGKKIGMTQIYREGSVVPVTLVQAGPCKVLQIKTKEKDGYSAVQLGFEEITKKHLIGKSQKGKEMRHIKEFREGAEDLALGNMVDVTIFSEGDTVKVSGISKGKGFQGGVKRHGFSGRNATHGVKHEERTIGSTGSRFPQHVIKGRRMPGRMGADRISVKNLQIAKIDQENHILAIRGAVPGRKGTLLEIRG
ncbi:MAG: 50S ribosomal protein L3 [Candidatus Wildermuthbacteria bacterium RIFCSPHIGHO2_01_FULL_45_20]|nr:MAG: 50S ribosomal protein L3 [Candidatus Wildermuthbacteria bacterium RIFCSPHIGHO2_01_FULL_45_20]